MLSFNKLCYYTWSDYLGLKLHFNDKIDWVVGRKPLPSWTFESFAARKDIQAFAAFVDFVPDPRERIERMISAFIRNPNAHVTTAHHMPDDIADLHRNRIRVIGSLGYELKDDLDTIRRYCYNNGCSLVDLLSIRDDCHTPAIVSDVDEIGINLETLSVLDTIFAFTRFESVSPLWNRNRVLIRQYGKLLKYDKHEIVPIVSDIIKPINSPKWHS